LWGWPLGKTIKRKKRGRHGRGKSSLETLVIISGVGVHQEDKGPRWVRVQKGKDGSPKKKTPEMESGRGRKKRGSRDRRTRREREKQSLDGLWGRGKRLGDGNNTEYMKKQQKGKKGEKIKKDHGDHTEKRPFPNPPTPTKAHKKKKTRGMRHGQTAWSNQTKESGRTPIN